MSLFSIVAREDFLSLVLDNEASDPIHQLDQTIFHEIIPNQSFFLYLGQAELGKEGWHLAKTLTEQGLDLYEVALVIQHDWQRKSDVSVKNIEAVIGGISHKNEIQYHVITME